MSDAPSTSDQSGQTMEVVLRAPGPQHGLSKHFYGSFPMGAPSFKDKSKIWTMHRGPEETTRRRRNQPPGSAPWVLEDSAGRPTHRGMREGAISNVTPGGNYFVLVKEGADFVAIPVSDCYSFRPVVRHDTMTLEEAEQQMEERRKNYGRINAHNNSKLSGMVAAAAQAGGEASDGEGKAGSGGDADESDAEEVRARQAKGEAAAGSGTAKGARAAGEVDADVEGGGEDEAAEAEEVGGGGRGEKGEEWDHEEERGDDDLDMGNDDDAGADEEAPAGLKRRAGSDSEEEEAGLSSQGAEMKRILNSTGLGSDSEDELAEDGDASDEEEDEANLGRMAAHLQVKPIAEGVESPGGAATAAEAGRAPKGEQRRSPSPAVSGAAGKRKAAGSPGPGQDVGAAARGKRSRTPSPAPAMKKPKTEPAAASPPLPSSSPLPSAGPPAPKPAVAPGKASPAAAAAQPAATAARGAATGGKSLEAEVIAVLKASGPILSSELAAKFKKQLKTPEQKKAFSNIVKKVAKLEENPPGSGKKFIVLKH